MAEGNVPNATNAVPNAVMDGGKRRKTSSKSKKSPGRPRKVGRPKKTTTKKSKSKK